jgi:hypothetical protein
MNLRKHVSFRTIKRLVPAITIIRDEKMQRCLAIEGEWAIVFDRLFFEGKEQADVVRELKKKFSQVDPLRIEKDFQKFLQDLVYLGICEAQE